MTKVPQVPKTDYNMDEHHMYTQMIDPSHASLSIMTSSNDSSKEHPAATDRNEIQTSDGTASASASASGTTTNGSHAIFLASPSTNMITHPSSKAAYASTGASNAVLPIVTTRHLTNDAIDTVDDTASVSSHVSFGSSTDGIDVLRGNIGTPTNFIEWSHLLAARVVSSVLYKRSMLFGILLSSILLAIRTVDRIRESSPMMDHIEFVLHFLLILFTIEMLLAVVCYRELVLSTGWLLSDIVTIGIVWYSNDLTFLILRAFRLIRALRKASSVPSLQWAVRSILHVLPRLTAVVVVLIPAMIAIFAILFTNLYQDADLLLSDAYTDDPQQYGTMSQLFHRLDVSALTLFQIMTGGRNWADLLTTLMSDNTYPLAWIPFIGYIIVSMFVATTLVIAFMCDAVTSVKQSQMQKVFDYPANTIHPKTVQCHRHSSKKASFVVQGSDFVELDHTSGDHSTESYKLYRRLEQKIDKLNDSVDVLLRTQIVLQESMERLSVQYHNNHHGNDTNHSIVPVAPLSPRQQQFQQQQLQPQTSLRSNITASMNSYSTALMVPRLNTVPSDEH